MTGRSARPPGGDAAPGNGNAAPERRPQLWSGLHHEMALDGGVLVRRPRRGDDAVDLHLEARYFDVTAEAALLRSLAPLAPLVPRVVDGTAPGTAALAVIPGDVLESRHPRGTAVPPRLLRDLLAAVTRLAATEPEHFPGLAAVPTVPGASVRTAAFLADHLDRQAVRYADRLGELLEMLQVPSPPVPAWVRDHPMTPRPVRLVHGDLHRGNVICAAAPGPAELRGLIDWELALLGDPLFDLAAHLWLMRYPAAQRTAAVRLWLAGAPPAATRGFRRDLPVYLALEDIRSVLVDTVRQTARLRPGDALDVDHPAVRVLRAALARARPHWGLGGAPDAGQVQVALRKWLRTEPPRPPRPPR